MKHNSCRLWTTVDRPVVQQCIPRSPFVFYIILVYFLVSRGVKSNTRRHTRTRSRNSDKWTIRCIRQRGQLQKDGILTSWRDGIAYSVHIHTRRVRVYLYITHLLTTSGQSSCTRISKNAAITFSQVYDLVRCFQIQIHSHM